MLLHGYGFDDKDKWLVMPNDNVEPVIYQNLIEQYNNEGYKRIHHGHYMDYTLHPEYYDREYAQSHILDISYLKEINNLEAFWLGATRANLSYINELNPKYLEYLSLSFTHLGWEFKKSNKIELSFVDKFTNLKFLSLNPDPVSPISLKDVKFSKLMKLNISYNDISNIDFNSFPNLESLSVNSKFDTVENYNFSQLNKLREIAICNFPKSNNVNFVSELTNLELIWIGYNNSIIEFPDLSKLHKLKWIFIENCKGIRKFENLATAPNLEKIKISNRISKDFDIELFRPITESKSLKEFGYVYDYQTKSEEKKLKEMFGDRYNPMSYQIFLLEGGGHHIIK